jgi:hypothetical protein
MFGRSLLHRTDSWKGLNMAREEEYIDPCPPTSVIIKMLIFPVRHLIGQCHKKCVRFKGIVQRKLR